MLERMLSAFENTATSLYKHQFLFGIAAFVTIISGMLLSEGEYKIFGFWLFLIGIWSGGAAIFTEIYSLKEEIYVDGDQLASSQIRNSSRAFGIYGIILTSVWILGMLFMTGVLCVKTFS